MREGGAGEGGAEELPAGFLAGPGPEFVAGGAGDLGPVQFDGGCGGACCEGGDGQGGFGGLLLVVAGSWVGRGGGSGARESDGEGEGGEEGEKADNCRD